MDDQSVLHLRSPIAATLPVTLTDGINLHPREGLEFGANYVELYRSAEPFPHIVLDNFLPSALAQEIHDNFPHLALPSDTNYEMGYAGLHKRQVQPIDCDPYCRNLFGFFNSAPVLQFLEGLTGIAGLIPDPYFNGAGFHEIAKGGLLGVHADFRIHEKLHLQRRINLLLYLNPVWDKSWGGKLELWDREMKAAVQSIEPLFNRCVIFNTDATSFHGHPNPLDCPATVTRKSIALYYYTASDRIYEDTPSDGTVYRSRPSDGLKIRIEAGKLRAHNYILKDLLPPVVFRSLRSVYRLARSMG
ncbi:MAG: 2OG-Fe(II) oxygenase [Alphaproteobacteria bacterium]|nr:2OG-Fe(II) oxygenase [Alphaproteobacteria bacterium]